MLTVVGLFRSGENITGFRVVNNKTLEVIDIGNKEAYNSIRRFSNIKISNGRIKGKSGVISKYGVVGSDDRNYTILAEIVDNGNRLGFEVADNCGNIKRFNTKTIERIHRDGKLTNGRLNVNGISLIKGTLYKKEIIKNEYVVG